MTHINIRALICLVLVLLSKAREDNVPTDYQTELTENVTLTFEEETEKNSVQSANEEIVDNSGLNITLTNETALQDENVNKTTKLTKVDCKPRDLPVDQSAVVMIVNSSMMLGAVVPESNISANECALVLFFASWCHFSALAAPHFNALARLYPTFHLFAINAIKYNGLNTRYGIVAVPTLLLFHNGRAIAKFNETVYSLENFVQFTGKYTNTQPLGLVNVTSADFYGPLPSEPSSETDHVLLLVWTFILTCGIFGFIKSSFWCRVVEVVTNNWREAEAQHEHAE